MILVFVSHILIQNKWYESKQTEWEIPFGELVGKLLNWSIKLCIHKIQCKNQFFRVHISNLSVHVHEMLPKSINHVHVKSILFAKVLQIIYLNHMKIWCQHISRGIIYYKHLEDLQFFLLVHKSRWQHEVDFVPRTET